MLGHVTRQVAIHQPNFLPWLGYFDKIARSDTFVLLDDVQFSKTGGNWCNHVRLRVSCEPAWITIPVVRSYHGVRSIGEMRINESTPWRAKLLRTLEMNYRRAAHFEATLPLVERLIGYETDSLADYNLHAIRALCEALGLGTNRLVLQSTLAVDGASTDLLIALVRAVGGETYLCGMGSDGYLEEHRFSEAGIGLTFQEFRHPRYPQGKAEFVPGLSILDALLHCGVEGTKELLGLAGTSPTFERCNHEA